jgi:hypothetical protein
MFCQSITRESTCYSTHWLQDETCKNEVVMNAEPFENTIPFGEPDLLRASDYRRYLEEQGIESKSQRASARISQLSPSLLADLQRFEHDGGSEVMEVLAACVRHAKRATVQLHCGDRVVPLTVFPQERLVHCPMDLNELIERHLLDLRVMHVEPAWLRPPGDAETALIGASELHHPLGPLLWEMALRGPRRDLLPEISGPAVYRLAPGTDTQALPVSSVLKAAIERLRPQAANLQEIARWPALDRERASRLLNALYLQAGLIVSRSHPNAVRDSWF